MGQKGSNTTTSSSSPNPVVASDYYNLLNQAQGVAATPYQAFSGQLVSPVNAQQNLGINNINSYASAAQPYLQTAAGYAEAGANPLTSQQIQQYQSPYTQDVINSTMAQFQNQNAQQQQQVLGNAAAQGALGGNRVGVAQSVLAGQQDLAETPTIAGLENTGYNQAVQLALQQQQNQAAGAYSLGNIGTAVENAGLTGANAQVGAGTLQQQTGQAQDTAAYQQYEQALAYPFQTTQWLGGLETGVGSQLGGTSQTTQPAPNQTAQDLGLGLAAASFFVKRGGRINPKGYDTGGAAFGGTPYSAGVGWVPTMQINAGRGAPQPPGGGQSGVQSPTQMMNSATGLANTISKNQSQNGSSIFNNLFGSSPSYGGGDIMAGDAYGGSSSAPLDGLTAADYGVGFRRGGHVPVRGGLGLSSFLRRKHFDSGGGAPYDPDYMDETFAAPIQHTGANYDIASNPQAMAEYSALASKDALAGTGIGPTAAYGQSNPYVPLPQPRPAAADNDDSLPPEITGGATTASAAPSGGVGEQPMAYAPQASPSSGGLAAPAEPEVPAGQQKGNGLFGLSSDAKMSLLAAGLGMAASRSPFLGVGIGQGGLEGLSEYGSLQQQHLAQQKQQQDVDLKVKQLNQQAKAEQDRVAAESRPYEQMTASQKADLDFKERAQARLESQPFKIGSDLIHGDVYAVRDPNAPDGLRRLDPTGGNVPQGPSASGTKYDPKLLPPGTDPTTGIDPKTGRNEGYLTTRPSDEAAIVKGVADYNIDPNKIGYKQKTGMQAAIANYDPTYRADIYPQIAQTETAFNRGKQGDQVRFFNNSIQHMATLQQYANAMQNGDVRAINALKNTIQTQLGVAAPNTYDGLKDIVGQEIVKSIVPGAGGEAERQAVAQKLAQASSPQQLSQMLDGYTDLGAAQLRDLKIQYENGTYHKRNDFDDKLTPESKAAMGKYMARVNGSAAASNPQDQQALQWANANPNDPRAIEIRRRLGQ